jgi:hypothetical protein
MNAGWLREFFIEKFSHLTSLDFPPLRDYVKKTQKLIGIATTAVSTLAASRIPNYCSQYAE